jgi:hypothetical protein
MRLAGKSIYVPHDLKTLQADLGADIDVIVSCGTAAAEFLLAGPAEAPGILLAILVERLRHFKKGAQVCLVHSFSLTSEGLGPSRSAQPPSTLPQPSNTKPRHATAPSGSSVAFFRYSASYSPVQVSMTPVTRS